MRLFIAINLARETAAELDRQLAPRQEAVRALGAAVRWVPPEQFHFTLKFLGDCDEGQVPALRNALDQVARAVPAFSMTLSQPGCFPPHGRPSILWVGAGAGAEAARDLAAAVEAAGEGAGFPREPRPYVPHLTVGRVKHPGRGGALRRLWENSPAFAVDPAPVPSLDLMESRLAPEGPTYRLLHAARLPA